MDFGGDRDSGCKQPVWARWIGALGCMWNAWMCEVAPRQRRVRTTDVEVGIVGAGAAGMPAAERARGRAGVRCGWWVCKDDVGPEYSTWTWLSPAGQGTYGWLRILAGPGQEAWHVGRGGVTLCCRCSARVQGGHAVRRGGHAVEGSTARWAAARAAAEVREGHGARVDKNTLYDVDIHHTTGIDRVLPCAHFPDVTRFRGPCLGGVHRWWRSGRCIVAPGICARRQMREQD